MSPVEPGIVRFTTKVVPGQLGLLLDVEGFGLDGYTDGWLGTVSLPTDLVVLVDVEAHAVATRVLREGFEAYYGDTGLFPDCDWTVETEAGTVLASGTHRSAAMYVSKYVAKREEG